MSLHTCAFCFCRDCSAYILFKFYLPILTDRSRCTFTLNARLRGQAPSSTTPPVSIPADLPALSDVEQPRMDKDLLEITIPQLQALYAKGKYTITDVTRWYIGRIQKYNGIYRAAQTVDVGGALQTARSAVPQDNSVPIQRLYSTFRTRRLASH
jgi:hypothetical protein